MDTWGHWRGVSLRTALGDLGVEPPRRARRKTPLVPRARRAKRGNGDSKVRRWGSGRLGHRGRGFSRQGEVAEGLLVEEEVLVGNLESGEGVWREGNIGSKREVLDLELVGHSGLGRPRESGLWAGAA